MNAQTALRIAFWLLVAFMIVTRWVFAILVKLKGERLGADHEAIEREGKAMYLFRWVGGFFLLAILLLYAIQPPFLKLLEIPLPVWLRWAGFGLGVIGTLLLAWAQATLGRLWSAQLQFREGHELITSGPFARMRHPLYSGLFAYVIGLALLSASWLFVAMAILTLAGMGFRTPREEQMMIEKFGDEYRGYMKRTWRFFPKI